MPGVLITLTDTASGMSLSTTTDNSGRYIFKALPPASYQFRASLPGFTTQTNVVTLASGEDAQRSPTMSVGMLTETVVVSGCGPAAATQRVDAGILAFARRTPTAPLFAQQQVVPIRVGGNIRAPRQTRRVNPVCPANQPLDNALVVILEATIGPDGLVKDIKALRPSPGDAQQKAYVQAAIDAVRQWEYTPTLLNNVPTPVIMTATISYAR